MTSRPHASPEGVTALVDELLTGAGYKTAKVVARLYRCACCYRRIEAFRAIDNRAIYAHLCRDCYRDVIVVSHLDHYEFVISSQ